MQKEMMRAQLRELLSESYKNITQGRKNQANADIAPAVAALNIMEKALANDRNEGDRGGPDDA